MPSVRLYPSEISALQSLKEAFPETGYIFGSRVNGDRRGCDIDILIINTTHLPDGDIRDRYSRELFKKLEMQWDIVVMPPEISMNRQQKHFYNSLTKIPL